MSARGGLASTASVSAFVVALLLSGAILLSGAAAAAQDMDFTQPEGEGTTDGQTEGSTEGSASDDVIGDLATAPTTTEDGAREAPTQREEAREEIFAVQQIYALRINRVEVIPTYSVTLNDPFLTHHGVGLGLNYWWTNVLALGVNFIWYEGLESESDLGFYVRRTTRLAVPVNSYQFGAHLNFTYVPIYGKFAFFQEFIFQYDIYVVGGIGLMRTRPIPVIDPEIRSFNFDVRVAFNLGIGLRVFLSRWLALVLEVRDYMYLEQLENLDVALGPQRSDSATWVQNGTTFTNNFTLHAGFTIFLPFDFEYQRPR